MARDRLISGDSRPDEVFHDVALRPQNLEEMVGQPALMKKLDIAMTAARQRGEPL